MNSRRSRLRASGKTEKEKVPTTYKLQCRHGPTGLEHALKERAESPDEAVSKSRRPSNLDCKQFAIHKPEHPRVSPYF